MIVDENDRRRPLGDRLAEHFARMDERRIQKTARYRDVALEAVLGIEDGDVKFLDGKIFESLSEDFVDIPGPANRRAFLPLLARHAPPELQRGVDPDRTGGSNPADAGETCDGLGRKQSQ
jgi:hypothetical protein